MATPSDTTLETMRLQGFIHLTVAAAESGLPASTLRSWAATGRVRSCRVGSLVFLELESLKDVAGPVFATKPANGEGKTPNRKSGGKRV